MSKTAENINWKLKRDDEVIVITGRDRGKKGKIQSVDRKKGKIIVPEVNIVKKHKKRTQEKQTGEIVDVEAKIEMSNVMIFCPKCNKGVRIKIKRDDNKKIRLCHRCDHPFDKK